MLIHYLVKDEPEAERFQSGLFQQSGRPKLAALAFPLPLAQAGRSGGKLVLWGQVRPRTGAQTFRVQVRTGGVWRFSGGVRKTGARGFFSVAVPAARGTAVRIFSPQDERVQRARCVRARVDDDATRSRRRAGPLRDGERLSVRRALRSGPASAASRSLLASGGSLRGGFARFAWLVFGLFLCACGIVCFLESELGLPPWDVLHQGLAEQLGISFGAANLVVSVARARALVGAAGAHRARDVPERAPDRLVRDRAGPRRRWSPSSRSRGSRCGSRCVAVALPFFGVGSAFYICASMGAGPRDSLMLVVSRRLGIRIGVARTALELAALAGRLRARRHRRHRHARLRARDRARGRSLRSGCSSARLWRAPQ